MRPYGTHLYRRAGTYYFRLSIPKDIQGIFGSSELRRSLDTGNKIRAQAKARRAAFELRNLFFRLDDPDMAKKPTHQEIRRIVGDLFRTIADESERRLASAGPVNLPELIERQSNLEQAAGETRLALTTRNHDVVADEARKLIAKHELDAPDKSPEFDLLCHELLKMRLDFHRVALARRQGDYTLERQLLPSSPVQVQEEPSGPTLGEGIAKYIEDKDSTWGRKTREKYLPVISEFLEIIGNKPLQRLNRDALRAYSRTVHQLPKRNGKDFKSKSVKQIIAMTIPTSALLSPESIDDRFVIVRSLLNWLNDEYPRTMQPLAQLKKVLVVERKATTPKRRAYTSAELQVLFEPATYTDRKMNKGWKYWLPLLGLFTGARLGELSQLLVCDAKQDKDSGIWFLDVNDEEEAKSVKTGAAIRTVPLHPILIELGFLNRVDMLSRRGETKLFPALFTYAGPPEPGKAPSKWFGHFRQKRGLGAGPGEVSELTFHSLRHTFITQCKHQGLDRHKVKEIVGHENDEFDDVTAGYEGRFPVKALFEGVVSKLDFSGAIDLEKLICKKWQETP
ncbi:MAG: site-specific integrase [Humidesulfovibrio sp.]|uniref:site-specific integrase n=1 Tax=Humidesulfovibrio sp. TaxID=2910988 RepID=UPI0027376104|nr:site-specific integrase [Humidesulfovibrio sp.]MDP2846903.1 site-specific integrase [Humidesulfovibrio sp.]